ncbi:hypothetical protein TSUD_341910 [Trifolium subterraneum]|nr:hypothetical protein TSUD_341910 [Trifolium subterraneum]
MHKNSIFPNNYTFPFLFKSLSDSNNFIQSQCVYTHVIKLGHLNDLYVNNSLLDVYASCGYRFCGKYDDALLVFEQMQYAGVVPNRVTMNLTADQMTKKTVEMIIYTLQYLRDLQIN